MLGNKDNARLVAIIGLGMGVATCGACLLVTLVLGSAYGGRTVALRNPFAPPTIPVAAGGGSSTDNGGAATNPTASSGGNTGGGAAPTAVPPAAGGGAGTGSSASSYLPAINGYSTASATSIQDAFNFIVANGDFGAQGAAADTFSAQSLSLSTIAASVVVSRVDDFIACYQRTGAVDARVYIKTDLAALVSGEVPPLGAVAVVNQDRLRDSLVACAVSPNDPSAFSAQSANQPCGNMGTFQRDGERFTYLYAGTSTEFCNTVDEFYARYGR